MAQKRETVEDRLHRMHKQWAALDMGAATPLNLIGDILAVLREMQARMNTAAAGERQRITRLMIELFQQLADVPEPAPKLVLTEIGTLFTVRCPMCGETPAFHIVLGGAERQRDALSAGVFCNHCNSHWMGSPDKLCVLKQMRLLIVDPPPED